MLSKLRYRFLSEINIIGIILMVLLLVGVMGYLAFTSLNTVVITSERKDLPNRKIVMLKDVFSDISDAQSSVRSFALSRDQSSLSPFYNSVRSIDSKMNRLKEMYDMDEFGTSRLDTLQLLIEQKYEIMNEMLKLQDDDKITESLNRITRSIEPVLKAEADKDQKKSSNILIRIFSKSTQDKPRNTIDQSKVKTAIAKTREEQLSSLNTIRTQELELNRQDKIVTDHIRIVLTEMEKAEARNLLLQALIIEEQSRETVLALAWFSLVVALLLFLVIYVIFRYVRKNKAFNRAVEEARLEAENLAKTKENFLANMSHEIRTPMNAISGFSSLLLDKSHSTADKEKLEIIRRSSDHLLEVINNILDYSKLQSGKLRIEKSKFSPAKAIDDVLIILRPSASSKNIQLNYHATELPLYVKGDALRLRQILINLIGNAIKFTDHGSIDFSVIYTNHQEKEEMVFCVADTGIGIEADDLERIFNVFEQGSKNEFGKYGGTGLGLSITLDLIHLFDGEIKVESVPGEGTKMEFNLIFEQNVDEDGTDESILKTDIGMFAGMNFLIVDDEKYNRTLLASILKKWNTNYKEAKSGREALDIMKHSSFDAVLMDLRMEGMGGIETTKRIRNGKQLVADDVPVIAVSAASSDKDRQECKEAGINAFLSKPFSENDLMIVLSDLLFTDSERSDFLNNSETDAGSGSGLVFSLEELIKMSDGNMEFVLEMVEIYFATARVTLSDIEKGLKENDLEQISHSAHKLAAPTRHMQAISVYDLLKKLEAGTQQDLDSGIIKKQIIELRSLIEQLIMQMKKELKDRYKKV